MQVFLYTSVQGELNGPNAIWIHIQFACKGTEGNKGELDLQKKILLYYHKLSSAKSDYYVRVWEGSEDLAGQNDKESRSS